MKVIRRRRSWLRRQSKYKMDQPLPSLSLNCYWSTFGNDLFKLLILAKAPFFFITVLKYISIFLGLMLNSLYLDHGLTYFSAYVWHKIPAALSLGNSTLPSSVVSNILSFTLRIPLVFCNLLLLGERMHFDFNLRSLLLSLLVRGPRYYWEAVEHFRIGAALMPGNHSCLASDGSARSHFLQHSLLPGPQRCKHPISL